MYSFYYLLPFSGCKSVVKETHVEEPVRIVSPNGDVYVGGIVSGKPHGQGPRTFTNGDKYVGEWKNGKENGNGKRNSPDGRNYVGEWKDGKERSQGTFTLQSDTPQPTTNMLVKNRLMLYIGFF